MTTTMSPRSDPLRMSLFGKVRNSIGGPTAGQESKSSLARGSDTNQRAGSHEVKTGANGWISNAPAKKRRSLWRKSPSEGKHTSPELPPALSLNFDEETKVEGNAVEHLPPVEAMQSEESLAKTASPPAKTMLSRSKSRSGRKSTSTAAPTPAAAVAIAAVSKTTLASPEVQTKYHRNARLKVKHATELARLCSQQIKMRGLATVGIFRPFRMAESTAQQERLIELFLLFVEPKMYEGIFSVSESPSSTLFEDTLGKADAETEFKKKLSYANIYDIVALLKWGLRRMKLQPEDLGSSDQYTWYTTFVESEKAAGYPSNAYSELLLAKMQAKTRVLFDVILDLMSTVSAHHVANAMPASRLCKMLGFWLVGRIGSDHSPHDLDGVMKAWIKANQVTEHLLMAFVRDQATRIHLMPSRLMEIVEGYPHIDPVHQSVCLPPRFSSKPVKALLIEIRSENVVVSSKRPRGPSETLRAALKAQGQDVESSEELDDWSAILGVACSGPNALPTSATTENLLEEARQAAEEVGQGEVRETDEEADARKEKALFEGEDARILRIVSSHFDHRKAKSEGSKGGPGDGAADSISRSNTFVSDLGGSDSLHGMRPSYSSGTYSDGSSPAWTSSFPTSSSLASVGSFRGGSMRGTPSNLGTLLENSGNGKTSTNVDWNAFSSDGFGAEVEADGLSFSGAFKPKTALELAFEEEDRAAASSSIRRQSSLGTLRRKKPYRNQLGSISSSRLPEQSPFAQPGHHQAPTSTLNKVTSMPFDESFVHFWQDQLLDDCVAARLPYLLVAQLNQTTASRLLGSGMGQTLGSGWLIVSETAIPPRPPPPHTASSSHGRKTMGMYRRRNASVNGEWDDDLRSEKRSIFAPSIRSTFSTSLARTKSSMKRMTSLLSIRNSAMQEDRMKKQAEIDQQVKELQDAVYSTRMQTSSQTTSNSGGLEVMQSSAEADVPKRAQLSVDETRSKTLGLTSPEGTTRTERSSTASHYQDAKET